MELAVCLAAGLRDWIDFGVIIGILFLNAIVGWYQEKQAADVVASLKGDIAMKATVIRDGQEQEILARELDTGDIVVIEEGTVVPADVRLICDYSKPQNFETYREYLATAGDDTLKEKGAENDDDGGIEARAGVSLVAVDQSAITGESLAVDKYMAETSTTPPVASVVGPTPSLPLPLVSLLSARPLHSSRGPTTPVTSRPLWTTSALLSWSWSCSGLSPPGSVGSTAT